MPDESNPLKQHEPAPRTISSAAVFLAAAAVLFSFHPHAAHAQAAPGRSDSCSAWPRQTALSVNIVPVYGDVSVDNTMMVAQITNAFDRLHAAGHAMGQAGFNANGLAASQLAYSISAIVLAAPYAGTAYSCAWPSQITLTIGHPTFQIYVAGQYQPGTCQYDAILKHESGHVAIDRQILRTSLPYLQRNLSQAAAAGFPILVPPGQDVRQAAIATLTEAIQPVFEWIQSQESGANAEHDSPASYAYTQRQCPRW